MTGIAPDLLRNIPLFALLDDQEVEELASQLDELQYLAGQRVFSIKDEGSEMYIVESGKIELYMQDKNDEYVCLGFREKGDLFGELSLLDNEQRSASAKAVTNTTLLRVDRNDLVMLVQAHPHAALDMMAMLGKRIREADFLVHDRVVARNANEDAAAIRGFGDRISDWLTGLAGDIRFVYFSLAWFFIWIVLNLNIIPGIEAFDPFPFGLLTMVVSLEAIFLSLFVLISQNRQAARDKVRNDIEYEVNIKAELEIRAMSKQIEDLQEQMLQHLAQMNRVLNTKTDTQDNNKVKGKN